MLIPLIMLSRAWSSSVSAWTNPSSKGMTLRSRVLSISNSFSHPWARLTCTLPAFPTLTWNLPVWISSSCISFWTLPRICMYYCSNCCHSFVVVSLTLSAICSRSLSMRIIGSMRACLFDLWFFLGLAIICVIRFFNVKEVLCSSPLSPPCSDSSYSSVCWKPDSLTSFMSMHSVLVRSFTVCSFSIASFTVASFFLCSTNARDDACSTSFRFCVAIISTIELSPPWLVCAPTSVGFHYSVSQLPTISFTFVSKTKYGNLFHICLGSHLTLMETLWKLALNSSKAPTYLNKVGDDLRYWLITVQRSISTNIQKILDFLTLSKSIIAHSKGNFAASSKYSSCGGNRLSSGRHHATSKIINRSQA